MTTCHVPAKRWAHSPSGISQTLLGQWLVREPETLVSGSAGRRVSGELVSRLSAMVVELRRMDDVAGGGSVLATAQQVFTWAARLLAAHSADDRLLGAHIFASPAGLSMQSIDSAESLDSR